MLKRAITEMIGTFLLVFFGTGAIIVNEQTSGLITHFGVSLVFGLTVFAMIYFFIRVSGAHINPAVSVGLWIAGKLKTRDLMPYIGAQITGAIFASLSLHSLFESNQNVGSSLPVISNTQTFILEMILTYLLVQIILIVDEHKGIRKHMAVIIGTVIFLEAFFAGPYTGASMNPARSIGPAVISGNTGILWIYILAPVSGGMLAALTHKLYKTSFKTAIRKI